MSSESGSRSTRRGSPRRRKPATYRDAGVDIDAGNEVVRRIEKWVRRTHSSHVLPQSHGAFGGFFRLNDDNELFTRELRDPVLVSSTDGVGTKLKVAFLADRYDTIGIDLVAMCVNDLVVSGARPLFFLDYIGAGVVQPEQLEEVVRGISEGCVQARCALLGGETAELPGFYQQGEFDLAGFSVGIVERARIIDGAGVSPGDALVGLPSSGLHSNGFSLARRVLLGENDGRRRLKSRIAELGRTLEEELLEPTRIYVRSILSLIEQYRTKHPIHAVAHITGGGLVENIPRVLPMGCGARLERSAWSMPAIFDIIEKQGAVPRGEMERVFNLGLGMVLAVASQNADAVVRHLRSVGEEAAIVGEIVGGSREVIIR